MSVLNEKCPDFAKILSINRAYNLINKYIKIIFLTHVLFPQYCVIVTNFEVKLYENRIRYSRNSQNIQ